MRPASFFLDRESEDPAAKGAGPLRGLRPRLQRSPLWPRVNASSPLKPSAPVEAGLCEPGEVCLMRPTSFFFERESEDHAAKGADLSGVSDPGFNREP